MEAYGLNAISVFGLTLGPTEILVAIVATFLFGQIGVVFGFMKIDKSLYALFGGVVPWIILGAALSSAALHHSYEVMAGTILGVLLFLWPAMLIVEWLDKHQCLGVIGRMVSTVNIDRLVLVVGWMAFFTSAIFDNVAAGLVMGLLTKRLVYSKENQNYLAGIVVIAANLGGIASPIGNPPSTLLWTGGQLDVTTMIMMLTVPCMVAMQSVLWYFNIILDGDVRRPDMEHFSTDADSVTTTPKEQIGLLIFGVVCLLIGIILKVTHLTEAWAGMLTAAVIFGFGVGMWHYSKGDSFRLQFSMKSALHHVDTQTLLFFVGILMGVSALKFSGGLELASVSMNEYIIYPIEAFFGEGSGVFGMFGVTTAASGGFSNTAVVAMVQDIYPIAGENVQFPPNDFMWVLVAFGAGVGGSLTLFGSAAGLAIMGVVNTMTIGWYARHMTVPAILATVTGTATLCIMQYVVKPMIM